ncbi:helicase C-terminal domain-containing protein [Streptomyces iconiensis]|uniref:Helicase C-terminal domain-containing protein n=1 Tax=Streptomyces iconiensis TaxID=1384038 RepID=A0ABT6ZP59_9ACTN|nr:helicase C-terminal domain-containing protein [Streptomyces iconiensis]MDJ1130830.1 helicase C-terminal domain-containing protein [Streptomyces iconiensis]
MSSTSQGSPLTAWLRGLTEENLHGVLTVRPDAVAPPEPHSLSELADRLQRPASVALALRRLPLPCLQAAEALAALGDRAAPDDLKDLLEPVEDTAQPAGCEAEHAEHTESTESTAFDSVDSVLTELAAHALVWPDGQGLLRSAAPLRRLWEAPLGFGPGLAELLGTCSSDELRGMVTALGLRAVGNRKQQRLDALLAHHRDPRSVLPLVASAPRAARELLEEHAFSGPAAPDEPAIMFGSPGSADRSTPGLLWCVERGLLVHARGAYGPALMPAEIALFLRGPDWHAPFAPHPPDIDLTPVTTKEAERETSAAAASFVGMATAVLSECAGAPPQRLKSGGVGVRELTRLGKAVQCEQAAVRLVLECARACGLLSVDNDRYAVTEAYDTWSRQEPAQRLVPLLRAWWHFPGTPSLSRDADGKALPALDNAQLCDGCVQARQGLLAAAGALPPGHGAKAPEELATRVAWYRPYADSPAQDTTPFATAVREAETLGVLARGALSPLGEALRTRTHTAPGSLTSTDADTDTDADADADADELREQAARLLPRATHTARFGADLTAVVPGVPTAQLAALLDLAADREARSAASVWRFGPSSVRRALDTGHTAESLEAELTAHCEAPLPQTLTYLLADTARRHGHIRVAPASCVIHSADEALISEIAVHRALAKLKLRRLAPTVLLSAAPLDTALAALRTEGYAPVAESADGAARVESPARRRAARVPRPRSTPRNAALPASPDTRALAGKLLAAPPSPPPPAPLQGGPPYGTDTEEIVDGCAAGLSLADSRQLAHAIDHEEAVTIEYTAASGNTTVRTLTQLELDPPYLYAWCHLRDDERVFALSRIHGVMPAWRGDAE